MTRKKEKRMQEMAPNEFLWRMEGKGDKGKR
jgi:hypothetical protein